MREEFLIDRQGKQFVLFAGLLDEAHTKFPGGFTIETNLVSERLIYESGNAIVHARFEGTDADGRVVRTSGIGDASADNVGRNIASHYIRMAETRAKARALRDAINVGVTSMEELGDESGSSQDSGSSQGRSQGRNRQRQSNSGNTGNQESQRGAASRASTGGGQNRSSQPATTKQKNYLQSLIEESPDYGSVEEWEDAHQVIETMDSATASSAINGML